MLRNKITFLKMLRNKNYVLDMLRNTKLRNCMCYVIT